MEASPLCNVIYVTLPPMTARTPVLPLGILLIPGEIALSDYFPSVQSLLPGGIGSHTVGRGRQRPPLRLLGDRIEIPSRVAHDISAFRSFTPTTSFTSTTTFTSTATGIGRPFVVLIGPSFSSAHHSRNELVMGRRRSRPNASAVTFGPTGYCRRFHSALSTRRITVSTVASSNPSARRSSRPWACSM